MKRNKLQSFISYDEGEKIRRELHADAKKNYVLKHVPYDYLSFMNDNETTFDIIHPQELNFPSYFGMFTTASQWVYGDCVEECLDKAMTTLFPILSCKACVRWKKLYNDIKFCPECGRRYTPYVKGGTHDPGGGNGRI